MNEVRGFRTLANSACGRPLRDPLDAVFEIEPLCCVVIAYGRTTSDLAGPPASVRSPTEWSAGRFFPSYSVTMRPATMDVLDASYEGRADVAPCGSKGLDRGFAHAGRDNSPDGVFIGIA